VTMRQVDDLVTKRLVGEPVSEGHRDAAVALFGDPEVAAWIWPGELGGARSPEQVDEILERFGAHWSAHGYGWWYLRERASGDFVGEVGLQRTEVDGEQVVEVGWTVFPAHWSRGFATEAAEAALAFGFDIAGLDEVVAFTLPHNVASRRVMEKLGLTYVRDFVHAGLPHVLYQTTSGTRSDGASR
jgi:RimJ/RimL family protein N-acetyltransferase